MNNKSTTLRRLATAAACLLLTSVTTWAGSKAEGEATYERFSRWALDNQRDSIMANKDDALALLADNSQWEYYYYVANLAIQVKMLRDDNTSTSMRECQKLYKFATDHYHEYGRASVQAQTAWLYGYIGDHQEAVRQFAESIATFRRIKAKNRDVVGIYYLYAYMLELVGDYDKQQHIINEGKQMMTSLNPDKKLPEAALLVADQMLNTEALMLVHRGSPDKARPLIEDIEQRLASGKEHSVYEAWRAVAEYRLATGQYEAALEATKAMAHELEQNHMHNSGLQWGLNLLRTEILRHLGRSDEAYDTLRTMMERRNTASISQLRRQLSEMDSQYQMDEMRIKEQKSHFWWAVVVSLIIIAGLGVFAYYRQCAARMLARKNRELADALEHAKESDRMKTAFVQHISHEIRTPLNIITGFAQVVSSPEYELSDDDRNRMLADISHNTNEITSFVNELLELSESESQSRYELSDTVDLEQLCQQVIDESQAQNSLNLQLRLDNRLPAGCQVKSNATALHKVLTRLMSNALKFTERGSVTIRLQSGEQGVEIAVEDTGIGIPPEHQEKIFERFYKVDSFKQGMGLGLTVARRTAELLEGTLTLDSSYTTGARFVLHLA